MGEARARQCAGCLPAGPGTAARSANYYILPPHILPQFFARDCSSNNYVWIKQFWGQQRPEEGLWRSPRDDESDLFGLWKGMRSSVQADRRQAGILPRLPAETPETPVLISFSFSSHGRSSRDGSVSGHQARPYPVPAYRFPVRDVPAPSSVARRCPAWPPMARRILTSPSVTRQYPAPPSGIRPPVAPPYIQDAGRTW